MGEWQPIEATLAVQMVAMLALDPAPHVAQEVRGKLAAGGLDEAAIDRLVDQARAIIAAPNALPSPPESAA